MVLCSLGGGKAKGILNPGYLGLEGLGFLEVGSGGSGSGVGVVVECIISLCSFMLLLIVEVRGYSLHI